MKFNELCAASGFEPVMPGEDASMGEFLDFVKCLSDHNQELRARYEVRQQGQPDGQA